GGLCRQLLKLPARESDAATIADEVAETLAKQLPDGAFGETTEDTAGALNRLFELGHSADAPEVQRGLDALLTQHRTGATPEAPEGDNLTSPIGAHARGGFLSRDAIDVLVLGGRHAAPETPAALRHMADHPETWLSATGCPWTANFFMQTLWRARHVEAVEDTVLVGLRWFERHMDAAGLIGYMDPWGHVKTAGIIAHPLGARQARRMMPLVLRTQKGDGGWGENTVAVVRMLTAHGLLDELRDLPPLPSDWTIERSIPAPDGDFRHMTYADGMLWAHDAKANEVVAVAPGDGSVTRRIPLPVDKVFGIAWHDGLLAACQGGPWESNKSLLLIGPDSGSVSREISLDKVDMAIGLSALGGRLWVGDGFAFGAKLIDPARPEAITHVQWPGTCAGYMAATDDTVWHTDSFAGVMIECDRVGELTDWAEIPFGGSVNGLAWGGDALWALDSDARRICAIERVATD
ncbi:MAG: hypothetical protein ABGY41_11885, partial [Candidatus Poribacteria bacterium]